MAASVAVFAVFAVHQLRRARAGAPSLIEPSVFAHRSYVSGIAFAVVFLGAMGAITIAPASCCRSASATRRSTRA